MPKEAMYMVKGISRQVIVLQSPETGMFEQAIFILKDGTPAVTDEQLLKEANRLACRSVPSQTKRFSSLFWACVGALAVGMIWLLSVLV